LACFECAAPYAVATGYDESLIQRAGVCSASLPTTMGLVAALLAQNALKYLLNFGDVSWGLGYNALQDYFPLQTLSPNPECSNDWCKKRQKDFKATGATFPPARGLYTLCQSPDVVTHEANDFGIRLEESNFSDSVDSTGKTRVVDVGENVTVGDLMAKLKSLREEKTPSGPR